MEGFFGNQIDADFEPIFQFLFETDEIEQGFRLDKRDQKVEIARFPRFVPGIGTERKRTKNTVLSQDGDDIVRDGLKCLHVFMIYSPDPKIKQSRGKKGSA